MKNLLKSVEGRQIVEKLDRLVEPLRHRWEKHELPDFGEHLYALLSLGNFEEIRKQLAREKDHVAVDFWRILEGLSPQLNALFIAPEQGDWEELPANPVQEFGLLPGDIVVIKQHQHTLWEWQHAGMIKDENTLYSAMYTQTVMEQPLDYYRRYATRIKLLRVRANHENPALGRAACEQAARRVGNIYGVSDKWYALQHEEAPMYCSQVAWYAWVTATGINLDGACPDYSEIADQEERLKKLCAIPHVIVYPTGLAESDHDGDGYDFKAKTECVLDLARSGFEANG